MIRVLHIIGNMNRGGAETWIMKHYRCIDRSIIQFDFVIHSQEKCDYEDEILQLGGMIYRVPYKNISIKSLWINCKQIYNIVKSHPYHVIHRHITNAGNAVDDLIAAKAGGAKTLIAHSRNSRTERNVFFHYLFRPILSMAATKRFTCSELAGRWMYGKKTFTVIPNAIDTTQYVYDVSIRNQVRTELQLHGKVVIGHVGRFATAKNHEFLIDIFKHIYARNNNAVLMLVGDGPLRQNIERKIFELGLSEACLLTGVRTDVPQLLQAMDAFLFPSLWEGLPNVVIEAQASGLPCVISDAITSEVKLTDLVSFLSLDTPPEQWADFVQSSLNTLNRRDTSNEIKMAGYDITDATNRLAGIYMKGIAVDEI